MLFSIPRAVGQVCRWPGSARMYAVCRHLASLSSSQVSPTSQYILPPSSMHYETPVATPGLSLPLRLPALVPIRLPVGVPAPFPVSGQVTVPPGSRAPSKEAARLIVIRRRKMRKHKLKKLRKRMRFVFAKIRIRRAAKKEKAFQAEQMALIAAANKFDAQEYVDRAIERAETMPMATVFNGKRLPFFIRIELEKHRMIKYPKPRE